MPNPLTMTRRDMLIAATTTAVMAGISEQTMSASDTFPNWIDAHSHIWPAETDRFPLAKGQTKKDLNPPSFTDDELMAIAKPEGVGRAVLIQHSIYHLFDNSYLIDAVERHPKMFRIVGMIDDQSQQPSQQMKKLLPSGVTGFRITPFIRKEHQETWLDNPGMTEMWKTGAETRQAMCCLINPSDLPRVQKMCEQHPDSPVVIDHFARIGTDGQFREPDLKALCDLASFKHTAVKVSAFYALGNKKPPHLELIPVIRRLYDAFGPERLMWASDCPYQIQGVNNYKESISLVRDHLGFLQPGDREWLLRKTAEKFFFFT